MRELRDKYKIVELSEASYLLDDDKNRLIVELLIEKGGMGYSDELRDEWCRHTGLSRDSFKKRLLDLVNEGLVTLKRRGGKSSLVMLTKRGLMSYKVSRGIKARLEPFIAYSSDSRISCIRMIEDLEFSTNKHHAICATGLIFTLILYPDLGKNVMEEKVTELINEINRDIAMRIANLFSEQAKGKVIDISYRVKAEAHLRLVPKQDHTG